MGVRSSTLRKYMEVLQSEGYEFKKNSRGRREYTEYDVMLLEKLIELSNHDGMMLDKAAKVIANQLGSTAAEKASQETNIIPCHIKLIFQEQYSPMMEQISQEQQRLLLEVERRLGDCIDQKNKLLEESMK